MVMHLSSVFGAIVFCFLMVYLRLPKILMLIPLGIELVESLVLFKCIDYLDLIFSLFGILIVLLSLFIQKKNNKVIQQNRITNLVLISA
jgi:hypothetical protein